MKVYLALKYLSCTKLEYCLSQNLLFKLYFNYKMYMVQFWPRDKIFLIFQFVNSLHVNHNSWIGIIMLMHFLKKVIDVLVVLCSSLCNNATFGDQDAPSVQMPIVSCEKVKEKVVRLLVLGFETIEIV